MFFFVYHRLLLNFTLGFSITGGLKRTTLIIFVIRPANTVTHTRTVSSVRIQHPSDGSCTTVPCIITLYYYYGQRVIFTFGLLINQLTFVRCAAFVISQSSARRYKLFYTCVYDFRGETREQKTNEVPTRIYCFARP